MFGGGGVPMLGPREIGARFAPGGAWSWRPVASGASADGTLAWTLRDPWPSAAELAGVSAQEVAFPSSSPFTPAEAGPAAEPTAAAGLLYLPQPAEALA